MAGLAGTLAMLAEASGCGAELDVAVVPRPAGVGLADWLTCFPGFALRHRRRAAARPRRGAGDRRGVRSPRARRRRDAGWPDGERTVAVPRPGRRAGPGRRTGRSARACPRPPWRGHDTRGLPAVIAIGAVAAPFDRDVEAGFARIGAILDQARAEGARPAWSCPRRPSAATSPTCHGVAEPPPALDPDGPEIRRLVDLAGDIVVCAGFCEAAGAVRYNAAVCVGGGEVLGTLPQGPPAAGRGLDVRGGRHVRGVRHAGRPARAC